MDEFFSFLFNTREGLLALFVGGMVVIALVAAITEKRTHKMYVDRGPASDEDEDGWIL